MTSQKPLLMHKHIAILRVYRSVCGMLGSEKEPCTHNWERVTCAECLKLKED